MNFNSSPAQRREATGNGLMRKGARLGKKGMMLWGALLAVEAAGLGVAIAFLA